MATQTQTTTKVPSTQVSGQVDPDREAESKEKSRFLSGLQSFKGKIHTSKAVGIITFRCLEAKINKDINEVGKMSPYCKIKVGKMRAHTEIASNMGITPRWHQSIVHKVKPDTKFAKLKLKDQSKYAFAFDRTIGVAQIPLESVITGGSSQQWIELKKGEEVTGEVLVHMKYQPNDVEK